MADHYYIQCYGELMDGRAPYKVYSKDDWLSVHHNGKEHDLNIWYDDLHGEWQWSVYPVDDEGCTNTNSLMGAGDAREIHSYEGH